MRWFRRIHLMWVILSVGVCIEMSSAQNHVLSLDEAGDYVEVPDHDDLDMTDQLTIELRLTIRDVTSETDRFVVKTWSGDVAPWMVYGLVRVGGTRQLRFVVTTEDQVRHELNSEENILPLGRWVHIAGVYDGTSLSLYVDGTLNTTLAATGRIATNDVPLAIGMNPIRRREAANALVDEVRLWSIAAPQKRLRPPSTNRYRATRRGWWHPGVLKGKARRLLMSPDMGMMADSVAMPNASMRLLLFTPL